MTTIRQDAWSTDEDLILAEVVLRHIREGSTQLAAFEEVGQRLSRTSAACGFRWNSSIRKKYESAIHLAKKQRTKLKGIHSVEEQANEQLSEKANEQASEKTIAKAQNVRVFASKQEQINQSELLEQKNTEVSHKEKTSELTMEKVLSFLSNYTKERTENVEYKKLLEENQRLRERLVKVEEEKRVMKDDYRSLLAIMDRARKLSL
ncbi:transcriptional regulator [Alkalihalobacillus alcalophilus ATCC 27647 = CGMCC 1.3604]|uniref:Transcriptional regulator n=1 Tax=Alkalihalobacillus alcalophilus ATCC 27647 = CGMCC 1.3604 TaxID=1218173 RepID=A0A094WGY1_ALKAL|nr:RsfA family transcriptional regulator [Alkalihalobacillus alcalophilus]KGA97029.1 transcriptional regulator [Alkalihalobacillus alcalophilus ATCC 27647 = CGMCC 1.3604]MED1563414.1 RsfA family transcriptional regulator [Alkalihalobacillus alcalophilus]THG90040.1 transcriptional regulator [Alkalihalobacillus alcalophilus ATCC 27647 = CGMCC 1.3604]